MTALMIAQISVKDPDTFQQYMTKTEQVARPYGAEMVSRSKAGRRLAGDALDHQMTVVVRFPSLERLDAWHDSPEYQELIGLRQAGADMTMTSYEEVASVRSRILARQGLASWRFRWLDNVNAWFSKIESRERAIGSVHPAEEKVGMRG